MKPKRAVVLAPAIERVTSMAAPQPPPVYAYKSQETFVGGSGGTIDNAGGTAGSVSDTPPPGYGSDPGTIWFPPPGTIGWY